MLVMNALPWKNHVMVGGKHFEFGPSQMKHIHNDGLANLIVTNKADDGFVAVPCEEDAQPKQEDIEAARERGIQNKISALQRVIDNLEIGLRRDLEMKNIKADHLTYASEGELRAYKQLAELKATAKTSNAVADEIRKIKEQISGNTQLTDAE